MTLEDEDADGAIRQAEAIVASYQGGHVPVYGRARLALSVATSEIMMVLSLSCETPEDLRALRRRVKAIKDTAPVSEGQRLWHYTVGRHVGNILRAGVIQPATVHSPRRGTPRCLAHVPADVGTDVQQG